MRILAIEGALARCSAALLADDTVLAAEAEEAARGHPSVLPRMAASVLTRAGIAAPALDAVAVGIGPGGFTGLRAAIALAEGIARGAGVALVGVTTGEALAATLPPGRGAVWAVLDHRRGRVVLEAFAPGAAEPAAPAIHAIDALPPAPPQLILLGDAAAAVAAALAARGAAAEARPGLPDAVAVARIAARRLAGRLAARDATPLYAEPPAVTLQPRAPGP
jgi:tRNA threonylcarbamoyladenosine biosynthesis protein TsaB